MDADNACVQRRTPRAVAGALGRGALLSAWYTVVTAPDAHAFLHRALTSHTGDTLWRVVDGARSVVQFSTLPLAAVATALGRTRIARISAFAVFANPPTLLLTALIAHDAANFLFKQVRRATGSIMRLLPLPRREPDEGNAVAAAAVANTAAASVAQAGTAVAKPRNADS